MKKIILVLFAASALMIAQDAAGQYKLSGVNVLYTFVTRDVEILTVTDSYGLGVTVPVSTIPAAVPFTTQAMQLSDAALAFMGINLNVNLNEDGTGAIADGSYYPDVNTLTDENGNCVTVQEVIPVNDEFTYTSMGDMMASVGITHPGINVLGLPGISTRAGQQLGGLSLSSSQTFENFPMIPYHPTLCDPSGEDCFDFTVGDIDSSGTIEISPDVNLLGIPEYVPGGAPLAGLTAGYFLKRGLNAEDLTSVFPGNTVPDFYLEWHGVDGRESTLGFGEDEALDEDGDETWFDRILGIPGITATYMNPACGFNQPIFGDVSQVFEDLGQGFCVDNVSSAASGYLMDASLAPWGGFLTAHAAIYQQCAGIMGAPACGALGGGILLSDDSDTDFNGSCLDDYDPMDLTTLLDCSGKLTMNFDVPCVGIIESREVVAEFVESGGDNCGTGDLNDDGGLNVLDVVALVNIALSGGINCVGDMNLDGGINVLDVVALVNIVLGSGRADEATSATIEVIGNEVTMTANGYVGAVQMTLSHGKDFKLSLTDNALVADYNTKGSTTTLMVVAPEGNTLFTANGDFTIESVIAASNENSYLDTKVVIPGDFTLSAAYPNPFNPATQMTLSLNAHSDVSVKVFNMAGQLVDVIAEGKMDKGSYSLAWDGTNVSSGVYFIKAEVGSEIQNQKIMLIK